MGGTKVLMTTEEFDNYPFQEDKRYELDEGEFIEMTRPAYRHNRVLTNLILVLGNYLRASREGDLLISENLYALGPSIRRAPDAAVMLGDRSAELEDAKVIPIVPEIVVEVISPSETHNMIQRKLNQYFDAGVKEAWLVYPEVQNVEIWMSRASADHVFSGDDSLVSPLLPGFELPLKELFA